MNPTLCGDASPRLISETALSKLIDIRPKTLQRWRLEGIGPKYLKLGNPRARRAPVRYPIDAVREWLGEQAVGGGGSR